MRRLRFTHTLIILVVVLVLFISCNRQASYKYMHDPSEIASIEIVHVGESFTNGIIDQELLAEIGDIPLFLSEFDELYCSIHYTDPGIILTNHPAIKFIYNNGDYELISSVGQAAFYANSGRFDWAQGFRDFDDDQFYEFVYKYIPQ